MYITISRRFAGRIAIQFALMFVQSGFGGGVGPLSLSFRRCLQSDQKLLLAEEHGTNEKF